MNRTAKFSFLVALAMGSAACGAPSDTETNNAAGTSDTLRIACSQTADFCEGLVTAFTEATGVKATYLNLGSGEVIARLEATKSTGLEFDVWAGGQSENHIVATQKGFVEPYESPEAEGLPAEYNADDGTWSGFYTDSLALCVNASAVEKAGASVPRSWEDLLQPELEGQVVMPDPATVGTGYMLIWTQDVLADGNTDEAFDYLADLRRNVLQFTDTAATGTLMAGRGEVGVSIALDSDCVTAKSQGMDQLEVIYPSEGTGFEVGAVSLLKDSQDPEAAKQFVDYVLTTDAQDRYPDFDSFAVPTNPEAELGSGTPDQTSINHVEWDAAAAAAGKADLVARFQDTVLNAK